MPGADHLPAPDDRDARADLGHQIFAPPAADWWIGPEPISDLMAADIATKPLDFGLATPARYRDALQAAGFDAVNARARNL